MVLVMGIDRKQFLYLKISWLKQINVERKSEIFFFRAARVNRKILMQRIQEILLHAKLKWLVTISTA